MNILKEIESVKTSIANDQKKLAVLEQSLFGDITNIHTIQGFKNLCDLLLKKMNSYYKIDNYALSKNGVKLEKFNIKANYPAEYLVYKGWKISFFISDKYVKIQRFKEFGKNIHLTTNVLTPINLETLIEINIVEFTNEYSTFKDGKYIDWLKENVFDVLFETVKENTLNSELEKIKKQQEKFKVLEDF